MQYAQFMDSGAVNFKVLGGGHTSSAKHQKKIFLRPSTVLALQVELVVLMSAFVMVSTVWSVSCLLFFYTRCPLCPAICKSGGGHVPPCLWSWRHCLWRKSTDDFCKTSTYEAYAGYANPIKLHTKSAPYPIIKYRLSNAIKAATGIK